MNYDETQQKQILREIEKDLLAIVAVDLRTEEFEVIYSDGNYRDYQNRFRGQAFFDAWMESGMKLIYEPDRKRLGEEIRAENLSARLQETESWSTVGRFYVQGQPAYCRIKAVRDVPEQGNVILSFRNIDREIRRDRELLSEVETLQETLEQMKMKKVVSQMHPHFLYNALSSIRELVLTDPEYGAEMLYDFTVYLRAGLRALTREETIRFAQELESIRAYVNIEKMRFGECLQVLCDIGSDDFPVLPLSIQPLVENAIRHGLRERGGGTVRIRTREEAETWEITVSDDGDGFDPEAVRREVEQGQRDSIGLHNLILRLRSRLHAEVAVDSRPGCGTTVRIRIPKSGCGSAGAQ